jgi:hypothetical protein
VSASRIQASVYGVAGLGTGALVLLYLLVALSYGAPLHVLVCVVAASSVALVFAAITSLWQQHRGRIAALLAALALGALVPPVIRELIPQHNIILSPINVAVLIGYLLLLAFVLFYPNPLRFSGLGFFMILCGLALFAYFTYAERVRAGEYARPAYACFRWNAAPRDDLVVSRDPLGLIDHEMRLALTSAGIAGTLEWTAGSWRDTSAASRLLVLAQSKPVGETKLCPAKSGLLIYAFDGERWLTYPSERPTYSLCLSLETWDSRTMIYQPVGGSKQGTQAFSW